MLNLLMDVWNSASAWYLDNSFYFWVGLAFIAVFSALFRKSWPALAGFDAAWNYYAFKEKHPRSSWQKATSRRYSWLGLGLVLYLVWVAGVLAVIASGYSSSVYFALATLWLITTPLRNFWLVGITRKADAKRGDPHSLSWWEEVTRYYENAFYRPAQASYAPWFDGRLKFLNVLQKVRLLWLIFNVWGLFGLIGQMLVSLVWPISAACAIFYYMREVEEYSERRAWWRFTRSNMQTPLTVEVTA
jgi:hypothetical protein